MNDKAVKNGIFFVLLILLLITLGFSIYKYVNGGQPYALPSPALGQIDLNDIQMELSAPK